MTGYSVVLCIVIAWSAGALRLQPNEHTDSPKLAICIVGAARMLVNEKVHYSLERHLLSTQFASGLLKATPDLFVSVHPGDSNRVKPDHLHTAMSVSVSSIRDVMRMLTPVNYTIEDGAGPYPFDANVRKFIRKKTCYTRGKRYMNNDDILGRTMNKYHSYKSCHNLVVKHEEDTLLRYDNVMFSRPDIVWRLNFPRQLLSSSKMIFGYDWYQVVPRNTSEYLGNLLDEHFLSDYPPACNAKDPEVLVWKTGKRAARKHGVKFTWTWAYHDYVNVLRPDGRLFNR